jgi:hypothetical protein
VGKDFRPDNKQTISEHDKIQGEDFNNYLIIHNYGPTVRPIEYNSAEQIKRQIVKLYESNNNAKLRRNENNMVKN